MYYVQYDGIGIVPANRSVVAFFTLLCSHSLLLYGNLFAVRGVIVF